jgi:hypothetical protein
MRVPSVAPAFAGALKGNFGDDATTLASGFHWNDAAQNFGGFSFRSG